MAAITPGFRPIIDDSLGLEKQRKLDDDQRNAIDEKAKVFATLDARDRGDLTDEELEAELAELDYTEVMPTERFLQLARQVLNNADRIINRANLLISKLTPKDPVTIPFNSRLDDLGIPYELDATGENAILPPSSVDCVIRLATQNPYELELAAARPTDVEPSIAKNFLQNVNINSKFKQPGIALLLFVIRMTGILIVSKLLQQLCKAFKKLPLVGKYMEKPIDIACELTTYIIDRVLGGTGRLKTKACRAKVELDEIIYREWGAMQRATLQGDIEGGPDAALASKPACDPSYVPTEGEIGAARDIAKDIYKSELNDEKAITPRNTELTWVRTMRSTAIRYKALGGDMVAQAEESPGIYRIDAFRGGAIGFFSSLNGVLKGIDEGMSGIIQLEWMSPKSKEWVCCFARLVYVFLPQVANRVFGPTEGRKKEKQIRDFFTGKVDWKVGKREKLVVEALEAILGWLLGSSYIELDLDFPFDKDILMGAIYESLAEVLAMLGSMMFDSIRTGLDDWSTTVPNADVVELCHPFKYWLTLIRCNINNLFANLMDLLSMMWLKGNEMLTSFDNTFEIVLMRRNVKLLTNVIKLTMNLGARLRQFCDLDEVTSQYDVEEVLAEVDAISQRGGLGPDGKPRAEELSVDDKKVLFNPVYKLIDQPAGPDPDAYVNTRFMRKDRGAGPLDINLQTSPMYVTDEDVRREVETVGDESLSPKSPVSDAGVDPAAPIDPCGDKFKELLQTLK